MRLITGLFIIAIITPAILIAVARRERRILREAASAVYDADENDSTGGCEDCHCHDDVDEDDVIN